MDSWVFIYTLSYNLMLLYYLIAQIVLAMALGSSFRWLLCPFDSFCVCVCVCVCVCITSLLYSTIGYQRLILYISFPDLESAISSGNLIRLLKNHIRIGIRNKCLGTDGYYWDVVLGFLAI